MLLFVEEETLEFLSWEADQRTISVNSLVIECGKFIYALILGTEKDEGSSIAIRRGDELNMEEFDWHEALDRTSLVLELFERSVCDHPVIRNMSDLQEKAVKISDLLSELYQDIGAKDKVDKPGWISYADVEKADADFLLSQSCGESALEGLAETMIKSTQGLLSRIDELEKRLDDTHVLLAGKLKS